MTDDSLQPSCETHSHLPRTPVSLPPEAAIDRAAVMLRAAGDSARFRILLRLATGERCVTEIAEEEGEKIATVSARLKQLHAARLVKRRREAKHIHYALADDHVERLLQDIIEHAAEDLPPTLDNKGEHA